MKGKIKKIICIVIMFISLIVIVSAISEFCGGYEEVQATVTKVYQSRSSHKGHMSEKYNIEWTNKEGEKVVKGAQFNKYGYAVGDVITIKVDAKTNDMLYGSYIPMIIVFTIIFIISGMIGFWKRKGK